MTDTLTAAPVAASFPGENFQRYYEEAGPDYAAWSPGFNMHFGFFRRGMNPFRREAMLEQMNVEVLDRMQLARERPRIVDLGCGLGATLRSFASRMPNADLHGITLVPWQVEQGRILNQAALPSAAITISLAHYEQTPYPSSSFDAACAIESSCYARGRDKEFFLREAHRLLRPGGRLVVADGFLGPGKLRGPQRAIFGSLCDCWAIDAFGEVEAFRRAMEKVGFKDIAVEPLQARVTPSVLHVPFVTLKFLLASVLCGGRRMTRARWNNVLAPILLPFVGYPLGPVAYYLVSATRA